MEEISIKTDADSGTFSGEESGDDMVPNPSMDFGSGSLAEHELRESMDKLFDGIILEDKGLIVDTFVEILKKLVERIKSNGLGGPLPLVLGSIKSSLDAAGKID